MSIMHPEDRELLRFLNNSCSELEGRRTARHLQGCLHCRKRLTDFAELESLLDEMPLLNAPDRMTGHIMEQVHAKPWLRAERSAESTASHRKIRWCPELLNGLVATAATFLLIMTGIPGKLMQLDAERLESGVQITAYQVVQFVETVSRGLLT